MAEEFFTITKDEHVKKENICKIDLFHQHKLDHQLFLHFLATFLKKYVVSRVVSGALLGAIKVALLRAMTVQGAF